MHFYTQTIVGGIYTQGLDREVKPIIWHVAWDINILLS